LNRRHAEFLVEPQRHRGTEDSRREGGEFFAGFRLTLMRFVARFFDALGMTWMRHSQVLG